jgi:Flp pilus assembly pilin Flp
MHKMSEPLSLALVRLLDLRREEGQGATEYGLVIALLVISLAASVGLLGAAISDFIGRVADQLDLLIP